MVATYLRALATSHPVEVAQEATSALVGGYLTGWQQTWMLGVLRKVVVGNPDTDVRSAVATATRIANAEDATWLARAEAARLLAHANCLDHDLLRRLWVAAPAAVLADLAAAVAVAARQSGTPPAWAEAFLDSLAADPMLQVVLARTYDSRSVVSENAQGSSDETAPTTPSPPTVPPEHPPLPAPAARE